MDWIQLTLQGGALVIVAWVVYHVQSITIPDMNARHDTGLREQREEHKRQLIALEEQHSRQMEYIIKNFTETIRAQRDDFRNELALKRGSLEKMTETIDKLAHLITLQSADLRSELLLAVEKLKRQQEQQL